MFTYITGASNTLGEAIGRQERVPLRPYRVGLVAEEAARASKPPFLF